MAESVNADVKRLTFERAIEELESIVKRLEEGKVPLEESVTIYERGEALKRRCDELLRQAEARVDKITTDAGGQSNRNRAAGCRLTRLPVLAHPPLSPILAGPNIALRTMVNGDWGPTGAYWLELTQIWPVVINYTED